MANDWRQYQEETAEFFRSLGLTASTDITLQGIRTKHAIDVFVTIDVAGFQVRWLVECKYWRTSVSKLHVLALREIVADIGADRGIILCEAGFQSGAVEAAALTNVQITSLAALAVSSKDAIYAARLRELYDRIEASYVKYWDIPKEVRIQKGLRSEVGGPPIISGADIIEFSREVTAAALRGTYPFEIDTLITYAYPKLPRIFNGIEEVVVLLEPLIAELEDKLSAA